MSKVSANSGQSLVLNTCPDQATAERLAEALVERGLAACVNIVPGVQSVYRWQGQVEKAGELLLLIKARTEAFAAVRDCIIELHPYELPEVIAVTIDQGLKTYLEWINNPEN